MVLFKNKNEPFVLERNCPLKSMCELPSNTIYDLYRENNGIVFNKSGSNDYFTHVTSLYKKIFGKCFTWFAKDGDSVCLMYNMMKTLLQTKTKNKGILFQASPCSNC